MMPTREGKPEDSHGDAAPIAWRMSPTTPAFVGLCLECNYPLMDRPPHRCTECGRPFDPADRQTFNGGPTVPPHARWAIGPISWPVYGVALAGCGVTLWRARLPRQPFSWASPVVWGWFSLALLWLAWPLVRRAVLAHYGWPRQVVRPMGRLHWVVPIAMMAMAALTASQAVPRLAFAASRADMDRLARDVLARPNEVFPPRRVGLLWAKTIGAAPGGGMAFVADDRDAQASVGYAYLPHLDPARRRYHMYEYVGHGWWNWRQGG